ncbi:Hypothetical_protein [Hexamita inflata]|uniref:Hypothetical_protein n=1 Tax=Hexamita inflata TaxID=28002 RepID=A0AA86TIJ9_9EUKA|nr:Hypothetical protein HINF_LOCUS4652 [Hexamita inflata]
MKTIQKNLLQKQQVHLKIIIKENSEKQIDQMGYLMQQQMDQGNINNIMCELQQATNLVQYFYNYPRLFSLLKEFDEETICFALNSITIDSVMASNTTIIELFINKIILPTMQQADIIKNQQYTQQTDMEMVKNQVDYSYGRWNCFFLFTM